MFETLLAPVHSKEKQKLLAAIRKLGLTVTPESIAVETGLPVLKAIAQLNLVAAETHANLAVDSQGSVAYKFSRDFERAYDFNFSKAVFANGYVVINAIKTTLYLALVFARRLLKLVFALLILLLRISFGVILVASILVAILAVIAAIFGGGDSHHGGLDFGGGHHGGGDSGGHHSAGHWDAGSAHHDTGVSGGGNSGWWHGFHGDIFHIGDAFNDVLTWSDPGCNWSFSGYTYDSCNYSRATEPGVAYKKKPTKNGQGFLEDCFSFLFGDGHPNSDLNERYWRTIGKVIQQNNGAVIAEQLSPYTGKSAANEDWMLPILVHFNGQPEVSESGNIIYVFPSLCESSELEKISKDERADQLRQLYRDHISRKKRASDTQLTEPVPYLNERKWCFSLADNSSILAIAILAVFNLAASIWLFYASSSARMLHSLHNIATAMVAFAAAFIIVPLIRGIVITLLNIGIEQRNAIRSSFATALQTATGETQLRLEEARTFQQKRQRKGGIIYSTDSDWLEQQFSPC